MKNMKKNKKRERRALAVAAALALGMSLALPATSYATQTGDTGVVDDEFEDGEQETVAGPDAGADTGTSTGTNSGSSSGSTSSGSSSGTSSSGSGSSSSSTATTSTRSSDSSLAHLGISPGSISPAFSSGTHEYTATVDANVTAISVAARPNDSKAVIASVTGAKSLSPGTNKVTVVVSAENGTTTTYTITVICGSASAATSTTTADTAADTKTDPGTDSDTTSVVEGEVTDGADAENTDQPADTSDQTSSAVTFDENGYLIYEGESYLPSSMMPEGDYVSLDKYNKLYEQNQSQKSKYMRMVIILAVLLLVACIAILNLVLKLRDIRQDARLGIMDLDDEDDDRLAKKNEKNEHKNEKRNEKKSEKKHEKRKYSDKKIEPENENVRVHKRSAVTEAQIDMIPDVQLPPTMAIRQEHVQQPERPVREERPVRVEKAVKMPKTHPTEPESDDLEILDLNDL